MRGRVWELILGARSRDVESTTLRLRGGSAGIVELPVYL